MRAESSGFKVAIDEPKSVNCPSAGIEGLEFVCPAEF